MSDNVSKSLKEEKKLLSYIWQHQDVLPTAMAELKDIYFINAETRKQFNILKSAYNEVKDHLNPNITNIPTTLVMELTNIDLSSQVNNSMNGYRYISKVVVNNFKKNSVIDILRNIANDVGAKDEIDIDNIINNANHQISNLASEGQFNIRQGGAEEDVRERREHYEHIKKNPKDLQLVNTGFKQIDDSNGGFSYGELIYIIGRKGDGKSVLMLNFAHNMWRRGKNVILFSLEISRKDYMRRFDSRAALVPSKGIKLGTLTEIEEEKFFHYLENLGKGLSPNGKPVGRFYVVDVPGKCTPAFVENKTEEIENRLGIVFDCVVVDYAQIMTPNVVTDVKRDNLGAIALSLKQFARDKNKIVISAAQMTRAGREETKTQTGHAGTEHVAESDQISDHIDWGIAIRSISDHAGIIESFKTRDGEPFEFKFEKQFSMMNIIERDNNEWAKAVEENGQGNEGNK